MSKHQQTGMRGVFLAAAELAGRGLLVSPTSRSAIGADLLATSPDCLRAYSVQVKTNARAASFWLMSAKSQQLAARSHIYVFVNIRQNGKPHDFYVVPSTTVTKFIRISRRPSSTWYSIYRGDIERYQNRWQLFGIKDDTVA